MSFRQHQVNRVATPVSLTLSASRLRTVRRIHSQATELQIENLLSRAATTQFESRVLLPFFSKPCAVCAKSSFKIVPPGGKGEGCASSAR